MAVSSKVSKANIARLRSLGITDLGSYGKKMNYGEMQRLIDARANAPVAQAPSTVQATPNLDTQIQAMQKQYTDLLAPSADETSYDTQLKNLESSTALGMQETADPRVNPVSMNFVTGQQGAIERRAQAMATPIKNNLALAQAKRQAALDTQKTNLGFLQDKYNLEQTKLADERNFQQQREMEQLNFKNQSQLAKEQAKRQEKADKAAAKKAKKAAKKEKKAAPAPKKAVAKSAPKAKAKSSNPFSTSHLTVALFQQLVLQY